MIYENQMGYSENRISSQIQVYQHFQRSIEFRVCF